MSYVSSMLVTCAVGGEEPAIQALNEWCEGRSGGSAWFLPLDLRRDAGGSKAMQCRAYAAAGNYFDESALIEAFPEFGWLDPDEALLVIYPEDGPPEIVRGDGWTPVYDGEYAPRTGWDFWR